MTAPAADATSPVRWGILSTARIAQRTVEAARAVESAEIVAVASRDGARAEAYAAAHGIPVAHASYEALLADAEVEAIYNPLPNAGHVAWTVRALEAGKHVLCEKPMARRPAEVQAAFDAAERAGRVLVEAFMWRHHAQTERLVELVREGAVGELRIVRGAFGHFAVDPADVRLSRELGGGALMDVGCYGVSALRLLCGEPQQVSAQAVSGGDGVDVRLTGLLQFPGDVLGVIDCGLDVAGRSALEVVGTRGVLRTDDPFHGWSPGFVLVRDGAEERIAVEATDPYARQLADVSAAIRSGAPARLGRDDALGQARAIDALYRSAEEGRAISL
jgi:D-xylose 1-dehydrogenase (NADP+, D-xylono-1,5-lactone-forming)